MSWSVRIEHLGGRTVGCCGITCDMFLMASAHFPQGSVRHYSNVPCMFHSARYSHPLLTDRATVRGNMYAHSKVTTKLAGVSSHTPMTSGMIMLMFKHWPTEIVSLEASAKAIVDPSIFVAFHTADLREPPTHTHTHTVRMGRKIRV